MISMVSKSSSNYQPIIIQNHNVQFALVLHFLHWCYTSIALLSANQSQVIFSCILLHNLYHIIIGRLKNYAFSIKHVMKNYINLIISLIIIIQIFKVKFSQMKPWQQFCNSPKKALGTLFLKHFTKGAPNVKFGTKWLHRINIYKFY